jgi:hypothetical protein
MPTPELIGSVRSAIYAAIVRTASAPAYGDVARGLGIDLAIAQQAYRALADAHVIVLTPGTMDIWSAPPFSAVPTPFRVRSGGLFWYAPCAWDAFGIPAALKRDSTCEATCAWSGEPLHTGVRTGAAFGDGVIHLLVPAARFWDDIVHT